MCILHKAGAKVRKIILLTKQKLNFFLVFALIVV